MKASFLSLVLTVAAAAQHPIDQYNVVWHSPSKNSSGSMPLGNGDIGLNVWVEENGDLLFYIGKTDAWSETARLLKLGRVRVRLNPTPFTAGQQFRQTLHLRTGEVLIQAGEAESEARISIWVDALHPVIHVDAETRRPTEVQAIYERWRNQQRLLEGDEVHSAYGLEGGPDPIISYGDSIHLEGDNTVIWYHRNTKSIYTSVMKHQGLSDVMPADSDPLMNRTFGVGMRGENFTRMNPTSLRSRGAATKHGIDLYALTSVTGSSEEWIRELNALMTRLSGIKAEDRRASHERWWADFWERSYIRITGGEMQRRISQGYALQRFINACGGRGAYPIKANGSIFTADAKVGDMTLDADYRRWGGPYRFRNTRLIYLPMLASGDFDLMQPFFRMFAEGRPLAQARTKLHFNHDGTFFRSYVFLGRVSKFDLWLEAQWQASFLRRGSVCTRFLLRQSRAVGHAARVFGLYG